jgi:hypothetical protein
MIDIVAGEQTLLTARATGALTPYKTRHRLQIQNGSGTWITYEDQLTSVRYSSQLDNPVASLEATLEYRGSTNLSPFVGVGSPAISIKRGIRYECAFISGGAPIRWLRRFEGVIDDVDPADPYELKIRARDTAARLIDKYIRTAGSYGSGGGIALETVMQSILTNWASGWTLFAPSSPGHLINTYTQSQEPVLQALRNLALRIGWDVQFRWDNGTSAYRLTLIDPLRNRATVDYTFAANMFVNIGELNLGSQDLRTVVIVPFGSGTTRGSVTRPTNEGTDPFVQAYGDIPFWLPDFNPPIPDSTRAGALADAVLSDLQSPGVSANYQLPFFPFSQLHDRYTFALTGINYDTAQTLAVVGIEDRWDLGNDVGYSTLSLRGKPSGGVDRWIGLDPRGQPPIPTPGDVAAPGAPTGFTSNFQGRDCIISWNAVADASGYEVQILTSANVLRRTVRVLAPPYVYDLDTNRADTLTPSLNFQIRALKANSAPPSSALLGSATNLAPSAPTGLTLGAADGGLGVGLTVAEPTFGDYLQLEVQTDDNAGFTSPTDAYAGASWRSVPIEAESVTAPTHIRARFRDVFNQASGWTASSVTAKPVTAAYLDFLLGGVNLLKNAGFDYNYNDLYLADDWASYSVGTGLAAGASIQVGGVLGSQFQRLEATLNASGERFGITQEIPNSGGVVAGRPYTLSTFAKSSYGGGSANVNLWLFVDYLDISNAFIGAFSQIVTTMAALPTAWTRYSFTSVAPAGAVRAIVYIFAEYGSGAGATSTYDLDAVMFEYGEIPTFYQESAIFNNLGAKSMRALTLSAMQAVLTNGVNDTILDAKGAKVYDSSGIVRTAIGDISGLLYGSSNLPSGTQGLYVRGGGAFLTDYPRLIFISSFDTAASFGTQTVIAGGSVTNSVVFTHGQSFSLLAGRKLTGAVRLQKAATGNNNLVVAGFNLFVEGYNGSTWENITQVTGAKTYTDFRTTASLTIMNPTATNYNATSSLAFVTEIYETP